MEHWLNINQKRATEWKLNYSEAFLCSFYSNEHNWVRTRIQDDKGDYLCIALTKLMKELPFIGKTKKNFSNSLNTLTDKKIFEKIIDEDNSKLLFYRINYAYAACWKYPNLILASDLDSKEIGIVNLEDITQLFPNGNTISKLTQLFPKNLELFPNGNKLFPNGNKVCPNGNLSNKQSNKQSNKHNHNIEDDKKIETDFVRKEFDKIVELYPYTINNTTKAISLAFGNFSNLTAAQRVDLQKAVKNYSKTQQIKDHITNNTTKFIQSLNTFITKNYTQFIYGIPENYNFSEEFEPQKKPNGATFSDVTVFNGIDADSESLKPFIEKFEEVKRILEEDESFDVNDCASYDDAKIKAIFTPEEYAIFSDQMGWVEFAHKYDVVQLADTMNDFMKEGE